MLPRAIEVLWHGIAVSDQPSKFAVSLSAAEIYCERIRRVASNAILCIRSCGRHSLEPITDVLATCACDAGMSCTRVETEHRISQNTWAHTTIGANPVSCRLQKALSLRA